MNEAIANVIEQLLSAADTLAESDAGTARWYIKLARQLVIASTVSASDLAAISQHVRAAHPTSRAGEILKRYGYKSDS